MIYHLELFPPLKVTGMTRITIIPTIRPLQIIVTATVLLILPFACCLWAEPSEQFKRRDVNRNGILEEDELNGIPPALFKRLDQNQDGKISAKEDETLFNQRPQYQIQTINYANNQNPRQELDILIPKQRSSTPLPCLIFVHGGGWRAGNKTQGHSQLHDYVDSNQFVGVSLGYRLSNEAIWPAQLHDCKAGIRYLYANADKLNIDTDKFIIFGTSAGGHLAAMIATTGNEPRLQGNIGQHLDQPSRVAGAISYFGPTDFLRMDDFPSRFSHNDAASPESKLIGAPIQTMVKKTQTANPITYIDTKDPPLICIHGDRDNLVPFNQSELLYRALKKRNVTTALIRITNGGHGGFQNPEIKNIEKQFFQAIATTSRNLPKSLTLPNQPNRK